jgi:hypothetical protein
MAFYHLLVYLPATTASAQLCSSPGGHPLSAAAPLGAFLSFICWCVCLQPLLEHSYAAHQVQELIHAPQQLLHAYLVLFFLRCPAHQVVILCQQLPHWVLAQHLPRHQHLLHAWLPCKLLQAECTGSALVISTWDIAACTGNLISCSGVQAQLMEQSRLMESYML